MAITSKLHPSSRPTVRDELMIFMYEKDELNARVTLSEIINEHCALTLDTQLAFTFYGKVYNYPHNANFIIAPPLHPDLVPRMTEWVLDRNAVEKEEKLIVKNLFTTVLNTSDSFEDWAKLLPHPLHHVIQWHITYGYNSSMPVLTQHFVDAFELKHERAINMLKGRLTLNLLY